MDAFRDKIEFIEGDVTDADLVGRAVEGVDCVFHEAALASVPASVERPLASHAACATGTVTVLTPPDAPACVDSSTPPAAPPMAIGPIRSKCETDLPAPLVALCRRQIVRRTLLPCLLGNLRIRDRGASATSTSSRPRQDPNSQYSAVIPLFITAMLAGRQPIVYGDGLQSRISRSSKTWSMATSWRPTRPTWPAR